MEFGKNGCISEVFYFGKKICSVYMKIQTLAFIFTKPIGSDSKKNLDVYLLNSSQHSVFII